MKKQIINLTGAFGVVMSMGATTIPRALADDTLANCRLIQRGEASWYGPGFNGKKTASGETFNQNAMTAAHNGLPFGTRVTAVADNGNIAELRINDTGGFAKYDRVIDVSMKAAEVLGFKNRGTTNVSLYLC